MRHRFQSNRERQNLGREPRAQECVHDQNEKAFPEKGNLRAAEVPDLLFSTNSGHRKWAFLVRLLSLGLHFVKVFVF
ncbi:hypothetical protein AYM02_10685 [Coxiella burnetii]|nr:hypothetical protein AUR58_11585 [Coxiella burnetii]AML55625.1 hypothetical protein AYM38_10525 [Coxiella burnetii]ARK26669.1 hypothetical protein BMW92_01420 [Coxiella burnetii]ATN69607.1 hypothetical protein AYM00_11055 [Coxiella burnetii]ATN71529.1 hypothetical protein AYM02_10685 [Coxiella burnetii]